MLLLMKKGNKELLKYEEVTLLVGLKIEHKDNKMIAKWNVGDR